ncbi:hypothetical protein [Kitasatospora sp. NPDC058218]|uniref:hypothetical protein n=1 Tax=Kitasatospora sp. NPDC058218 TaxID=3346385 RepID=UPI0036D89317
MTVHKLTDLIAERLADAQEAGTVLEAATVGEVVAQAVADVRARPDVLADELESGPAPDGITTKAWRRHVTASRDLVAQHRTAHPRGRPSLRRRRRAEDVLAAVADNIGITAEEILACRSYAISGDVRAMDGW